MTRLARLAILLGLLLAVFLVEPAHAATGLPLRDTLGDPEVWRAYQARFVTASGRVVDTANGDISHSEGQGYGMLLAVAADDRAAFDRIWTWTRANLMVRNDQLVAWRWEPNKRPGVADLNNASDGDLLIAWALTEAAESWGDLSHRVAARRIAVELGRKLVLPADPRGALLLPAVAGFSAEDRADGPVVNLSYWVFPAFERLPVVAPEFDWAGLSRSGVKLLDQARFGSASLPVEWTALAGEAPRPAEGFKAVYGYNAVRIPLYLAWAGLGGQDALRPYLAAWARGPAVIEAASGRPVETLSESGYATILSLAACAADPKNRAGPFRAPRTESEHYYPVTLALLSRIAARMRYPQCLRG